MKGIAFRYLFIVLFVLAGLTGGFLYWKFIGCNSGSCPLTANWHTSSLVGGLLGFFGGSSIRDMIRKRDRT